MDQNLVIYILAFLVIVAVISICIRYRDNEENWRFFLEEKEVTSFDGNIEEMIRMTGNMEYVYFSGTSSYITKSSKFCSSENIKMDDSGRVNEKDVKNILGEGYPHYNKNGIVVSKEYLYNITEGKSLNFEKPYVIPCKKEKVYEGDTKSQLIPKVIYQTFKSRVVPKSLAKVINSLVENNQDYEYRYFDDYDQREYIRKNFDGNVLKAFDSLVPGAYRSDLWRACVLYIEGGVYIDIKLVPIKPLGYIIKNDTSFLFVNDVVENRVYNAFVAVIPKHKCMLNVINLITKRVTKKKYGQNPMYPTGPLAWGKSIFSYYEIGKDVPIGDVKLKKENLQIYQHSSVGSTNYFSNNIVDENHENLISIRTSDTNLSNGYVYKITGLPHYTFLWLKKLVYK